MSQKIWECEICHDIAETELSPEGPLSDPYECCGQDMRKAILQDDGTSSWEEW